MTDTDLFIVRAKTKRGRIVYFLANFQSLIEHKHIYIVQYLNEETKKWIEFSDIQNGTVLAQNMPNKKYKFQDLGPNVYYGFQVNFEIYQGKQLICSKLNKGNPTEFYGYIKSYLYRHKYDLQNLTYKVKIIDFEDWYTSRSKNEKRTIDKGSNFTIVHV